MKRCFLGLCMVIFLLASHGVIFAADALYRMLHADEVESFKEDQDALIVGKLTDKQGDMFNVSVFKVLNGKVSSESIRVDADFYYGWNKQAKPTVNDNCVFSLKQTGNFYKKAWGIFKANSGDYQTLKLEELNVPADAKGLLGDLTCIQWYVNSDGKESEFSGSSGAMFVRRPNGDKIQLYPVSTITTETDTQTIDNNQKGLHDSPTTDNTQDQNFITYSFLIVVVLIALGSAVFAACSKSKT